jgi:DNA-binding LacI/PurR family transcriptional regulator
VPPTLAALAAAGRRLPEDVTFVAYGDSEWARAYRPPLSVVGADTYAVGLELATALLDRLTGLEPAPRRAVGIGYVERGSCGPPPGT